MSASPSSGGSKSSKKKKSHSSRPQPTINFQGGMKDALSNPESEHAAVRSTLHANVRVAPNANKFMAEVTRGALEEMTRVSIETTRTRQHDRAKSDRRIDIDSVKAAVGRLVGDFDADGQKRILDFAQARTDAYSALPTLKKK